MGDGWPSAAQAKLAEGMAHEKCYACGCMHDGLARLERVLEATGSDRELLSDVRDWQTRLSEQEVDCRGCPHCYPAEASNLAMEAVDEPQLFTADALSEERQFGQDETSTSDFMTSAEWPPIPGDYHAMCTGADCPVAVSTLGDDALADELAANAPDELCIVGQTRTENTGIEKLLKNIITNPTIQILVLAGPDPDGHQSGETMKALLDGGVTEEMQITDAPGRRPVLANTTPTEVQTFREQVDIIDQIGCTDLTTINETVVAEADTACTCGECLSDPMVVSELPRIKADPSESVRMDPAGYFVVIPQLEDETIVCEHYDYDHTRQLVIEGETAEGIYREIIERELVTQLDHAAYLGAELTKAELAISQEIDYEQGAKPD